MEQFEFDFRQVFPKELDEGDLNSKFEVLVFVGGSIPRAGGDTGGRRRFRGRTPKPEDIPEEYHDWLGSVTVDKTIPKLKEFLEQGGTILTIGSATSLASHLELPLENPLLEKKEDGSIGRIGREKYYIPGSVLKVRVNNQEPLAYGMEEHTDIYFNNSPVFRLLPEATIRGVRPIAWFDSEKPLRSGWAWGQDYLKNTVAVAQAKVGKGHLFLFGPEITYRSQPHASFKFLFNGIYYGPAVAEE